MSFLSAVVNIVKEFNLILNSTYTIYFVAREHCVSYLRRSKTEFNYKGCLTYIVTKMSAAEIVLPRKKGPRLVRNVSSYLYKFSNS
jgi:hypothetical protein